MSAEDIELAVLNEAQAAKHIGVSKPTLQRMRVRGEGPKVVHLSKRRIGYRRAELDDWLERPQRLGLVMEQRRKKDDKAEAGE
ncbi:helix-turn-helix transcriptional regulator [Rhizobium sp. RAF56]|uniref:helix-turn-helix transcriptional regulator n=1 Tax=Rhizobium sp. RAF56 TaxID=3233062 RepID=UPI003F994DE0